jgi:hypothetical protein
LMLGGVVEIYPCRCGVRSDAIWFVVMIELDSRY